MSRALNVGDRDVTSGGPEAPVVRKPSPACLESDALFQGQNGVSIQRNGAVYRLQATKLGKLILTR